MVRAKDVALQLLWLASAEEEPDQLSHLRLQKLLYYVQGWSLGLRGRPMFGERIEAWAHGPVVRDLYPVFSPFGFRSISPEDAGVAEDLDDEEREFIRSVWDAYKAYSATSLRDMTHRESPWLDARRGHDPTDRCEVEITRDALKAYFNGSESG